MNEHMPVVESEDVRQLKLLGLFHYILAGVMALFGLCPLLYVLIGLLMMAGVLVEDEPHGQSVHEAPQVMRMDAQMGATIMPAQFQVDVPGASEPGRAGQEASPSQQQRPLNSPRDNQNSSQSPSRQNHSYEDDNGSPSAGAPAVAEPYSRTTRSSASDRKAAAGVGLFFAILGLLLTLLGWVQAILIAIAGHKLRQQRGRTFCFFVAILELLWMPLGTILGIFTIMALTKPSIKELFEANRLGQNPADVWQAR